MESGKALRTFISKKGNTVSIRSLTKEDVDVLFEYANAIIRDDTFVNLSGKEKTREEQETYVHDALALMEKGEKVHLLAFVGDTLAGSFELRVGSMRTSKKASIGISIASEFRDEGIGTICMETLIGIARDMHLHVLELTCFAINTRAIHVYEKLGFKKVGVIPKAYLYKGKYEDEAIYYLPL